MTNQPANPITVMRGGRTQEKFAFDINTALGVYVVTNVMRISRLESTDYASKHNVSADTLAVFALYSGRPLADLYREYQAWVQSLTSE